MILFVSFALFVGALPQPLQILQKKFSTVQSFDARFSQEAQQNLFPDHPDKAEGMISFKRPGWMRWSYEKPEKRIMTYENREILVEESGKKEKISTGGPVTFEESFSFLWGKPDPKLFKIEAIDATHFRIVPKKTAGLQFSEIQILVENSLVREARVVSAVDGVNILRFSDWKLR
jgi:outer membrane lipoprotein-sorting protein